MGVLVAATFLATAIAVSAQESLMFTKPGISADEFEADKRYCLSLAAGTQPRPGAEADKDAVIVEGIVLDPAAQQIALTCMRDLGYTLSA